MVNFDTTREEARLIMGIAKRTAAHAAHGFDLLACEMDITACHANGCPLDLARLLAAEDFNFAHDVYGIMAHIDRSTGKLRDCFLPRFARAQEE